MKKYIQKLHAQPPHQKREFAVHAAAVVTAAIFLVWLSTLGVRFLNSDTSTTFAGTDAGNLIAATAAAGAALQGQMQEMSGSAQSASSQPPSPSAYESSGSTLAEPAVVIGSPE